MVIHVSSFSMILLFKKQTNSNCISENYEVYNLDELKCTVEVQYSRGVKNKMLLEHIDFTFPGHINKTNNPKKNRRGNQIN